MNIFTESIAAAKAILTGLQTTGSHVPRKPVTFQYPEQPKPVSPRFKGRHLLQRYENGLERCIGCSLCAAACPAEAIYVEAAENNPDDPISYGERYAKVYEINLLRCIYCGFCEDACPVDAVVMGKNYELSNDDKSKFIIDKSTMLVPEDKGFGENEYVGGMGF
ncbi:MAG TPA: NADH-quinone oxidoreductase subunit NuoI [bacterium]|jgi:NADH-quinone oxidoreductase subunit I